MVQETKENSLGISQPDSDSLPCDSVSGEVVKNGSDDLALSSLVDSQQDVDIDIFSDKKEHDEDLPFKARPFPLGSPFFYSSDFAGSYSHGGDDSDVERISLPPPSSPVQDNDLSSPSMTGEWLRNPKQAAS